MSATPSEGRTCVHFDLCFSLQSISVLIFSYILKQSIYQSNIKLMFYSITQSQLLGLDDETKKEKIMAYMKQFQSIKLQTMPLNLSFPLSSILPYKQLKFPPQIQHILNEIQLKQVPDSFASFNHELKEGSKAKLNCEICNSPGYLFLQFNQGIFKLQGHLSQIRLPNALTLRGSSKQEAGLQINILVQPQKSHLKIAGILSILDLVDRPVYGHSDINGIIFRTEGPILIFGLDFIENSFELKAGLLRLNDNFIAEADLKVGPQTFDSIEKILIEAAKNEVKPYEQAKEDYNNKKQSLIKNKQTLINVSEKEINTLSSQKEQCKKMFDSLRNEAASELQKETKLLKEKYDQEEQRLNEEKTQAHQTAWKAHDDELMKADEELNSQQKRAAKRLQQSRQQIQKDLRSHKDKLEQIKNMKKGYQNAPMPYQQKKYSFSQLSAAQEAAKAALRGAEELAKASLASEEYVVKGLLQVAEQRYFERIKKSIETTNEAITHADKIYHAALQSIQTSYQQKNQAALKLFQASITTANRAANQEEENLTAELHKDYLFAKQDFDLGELEVMLASQNLAWAEKAANAALNFLKSAVSGLNSILKFRKLHFTFDIGLKRAAVEIDLSVCKKTLVERMSISFDETPRFVTILANRIWEFVCDGY